MPFQPKFYSQRDPRWAKLKLGASSFTMQDEGCTTTCCARIASNVLQRDVTPGELCRYLSAHGGYTKPTATSRGGLLNYAVFIAFCKGKVKYLGTEAISAAAKKTAKYLLRIVQWGKVQHFVCVKANNRCLNPWTGKDEPIVQPQWKVTNQFRYFA